MSKKSAAAAPSNSSSSSASGPKDLWAELESSSAAVSSSRDSTLIFLGSRSSGKSTLIQSFLFKDREEIPKPTTSLDYRCTRTGIKDSLADDKSVSHFWELGGGRAFVNLLEICLNANSLESAAIFLVLDLSSPARILADCNYFLSAIRKRVEFILNSLKKSDSAAASGISSRLAARNKKLFGSESQANNQSKLDPIPIPVIICLNKFDLTASMPPESLKQLTRALRNISHLSGCHLMYTSKIQREIYLKSFKSRINSHLLGSEPSNKKPQQPVVDPAGVLNIPPATDSLANLSEPQSGWAATIKKLFPPSAEEKNDFDEGENEGNDNSMEEVELLATAIIRIPAFTSDLLFDRHAALKKSSFDEFQSDSNRLTGVSECVLESRELSHPLLSCARISVEPSLLQNPTSAIRISFSNPTDHEISIAKGNSIGRFSIELMKQPELPAESIIDEILKSKEEDFKKSAREAATRRRMNAVEIAVK